MNHRLILLIAVTLMTSSVLAQAPPPIPPDVGGQSPEAFVETLGEVKYCQEAYKHPMNKSRVYEFDIQQCDAAMNVLQGHMSGLPESARTQIDLAAQQRQRIINANTRDITRVLGACRETCGKLAPSTEAPAAQGK